MSACDVEGMSWKLEEVLGDPERMSMLSRRNLMESRGYHADVLRERRRSFCQFMKDQVLRNRVARQGV